MEIVTKTDYTYRLFRESDMPGVLQLWSEHSGWGPVTEEQFRRWYLDTPYGPCLAAVMEDENGRIMGQKVMIPTRAMLNGQEIKVLRVAAPILHSEARHTTMMRGRHPAIEMYRCLMAAAQTQGYAAVYSFPAAGWQAFMKVFPKIGLPAWHIQTYDCYRIQPGEIDPARLSVHAGETQCLRTDLHLPDFDRLWEAAQMNFPARFMVNRKKDWIMWRHGALLNIAVRDQASAELKAYVTIHQKSGLLTDAFAASPSDLKAALYASIWRLHPLCPERLDVPLPPVIKIMGTPRIMHALKDLPLEKEDFTFTFGYHPLQDTFPVESLKPEDWYLMPND